MLSRVYLPKKVYGGITVFFLFLWFAMTGVADLINTSLIFIDY
jgi:hypothetical protein